MDYSENLEHKLHIAVFPSAQETKPNNKYISIKSLQKSLQTPSRLQIDSESFSSLTSKEKAEAKNGKGYILGKVNNSRSNENIEFRDALTLDIDKGQHNRSDISKMLHGIAYLAHSTTSSTPDNPRYRVIIPLSKSVSPQDYTKLTTLFVQKHSGIDSCSTKPSQLMYAPRVPSDADYQFWSTITEAELLDVDGYLEGNSYSDASKMKTNTSTVTDLPDYFAQENERKKVEIALQRINADDYDVWIKVGMALKHSEQHNFLDIYHAWSSTSVKYSREETDSKWNSFSGKAAPITLASIYQMAKQSDTESAAKSLEQELMGLALQDEVEYEFKREELSEKYGIRKAVLDKEMDKARSNTQKEREASSNELIAGVEPWEHPVTGLELVYETVNFTV